jgi:hypothetical protein
MDSHPLLEWMIHHPKMEADYPQHMKVGPSARYRRANFIAG